MGQPATNMNYRMPAGAGKPRVLFVDDERRVLNSMRALFRRDYELYLTTAGAEAVRIAEENDIDVIVADQRMPGMTGVEVLGEVKARAPSVVRILLTGYADLDAIEGSINVGEVFRFLSKPCPPQQLRETLEEAVQIARDSGAAAKRAAGVPAHRPGQAAPHGPVAVPTRGDRIAGEVDHDATIPSDDNHAVTMPNLEIGVEQQWLETSDTAETPGLGAAGAAHADNSIVIEDESAATRPSGCEEMEAVGIVVFAEDATFAESVENRLGRRYRVNRAGQLSEVTELLAECGAGVMVTDYSADGDMLRNMLSTLKRYLPELVTVVVSQERDATEMISLINHGQVFRYMSKPVDGERLAQNVNAAVLRHIQLCNNPELVQRHSVIPDQPPRQAGAFFGQFVDRLRSMRRLWARS